MDFRMYKYLKQNEVDVLLKKHLLLMHYWHTGDDFGLKYRYIELRHMTNKDFKIAQESTRNEKEDNKRVFLLENKLGYSLSGLHGYSNHFESPPTIKYNGLWHNNPKEWEKIIAKASI